MWNLVTKVGLLTALLVMPSLSYGFSGSFIEGQITEDGTNAPLANVIVTAVWVGTAGGDRDCLHSASAFSDAQGRYRIAEWPHPQRIGRYTRIAPAVTAYLPGYVQRLDKGPATIVLMRDRSSKKQRLETLNRWRAEAVCASSAAGKRIASPLQSALLEEAKTLVDPQTEQEALELFQLDAESQQFGEAAAKRRQEVRRGRSK